MYQSEDIVKFSPSSKEDIIEFIKEKILEVKSSNEFVRALRYYLENRVGLIDANIILDDCDLKILD